MTYCLQTVTKSPEWSYRKRKTSPVYRLVSSAMRPHLRVSQLPHAHIHKTNEQGKSIQSEYLDIFIIFFFFFLTVEITSDQFGWLSPDSF